MTTPEEVGVMAVAETLRTYAKRLPRGKPVCTETFLRFGSRAAVDQALSRLVSEGVLSRVGRGVFVRPKVNPYVGELPPRIEEIARVKAKGAILQVSGAKAAMELGLSTQVPAKALYLTNGPSHTFKAGKLEITLKHVSSRKLALAGRPAGLAILAFWYLGKEGLRPEVIEQVRRKLPEGEFEALKREIRSMPVWMQSAMKEHETMAQGQQATARA